MHRVFARSALLPAGWAEDVLVTIAADGSIASACIDARPGDAERVGVLLPGMPNLHSHAFQRAMAGLGERAAPGRRDSFWTWREVMYGFVARLTPEHVRDIAAQLYLEMVEAGYTGVAEFHYLHHQPDGQPYADPAAMAAAVIDAAREIGIGLTLLPVLYAAGDFGGAAPAPGQRRFLHQPGAFGALVAELHARHRDDAQVRIGVAPHSLRAVPADALARALADVDAIDPEAPVHIHVAEQQKEVDDCLAWSGQRPVAWLLDHAPVGPRWCLVHATHMTADETRALAARGAVAGLCPTTEANLGDGLFPLAAYLEAGGRLGIGSDSHVSVDPIEELRWLEYGQRLAARARNLAATAEEPSTGARLYRAALAGGAQSLARPVGAIAPGMRADLVVVDHDHPLLCGRDRDLLLDALVFSGNQRLIRDVMIGGAWVVRDGAHRARDTVRARFCRTMERLLA